MVTTGNETVRVGVGIDTARFGHHATVMNADREIISPAFDFAESVGGYEKLEQRLRRVLRKYPNAHFHVHIDAAGQYAINLERFLRSCDMPITLSIGEPKRNKDYHRAMSPKRKSDDSESYAMARFAISECPSVTAETPEEIYILREIASRLESQVKTRTQAINRFHNLLARVFPELAMIVSNVAAHWVLKLLDKYPTPERMARASLTSLEKIPHIRRDKAKRIHEAAQATVGSFRGAAAEQLVRQAIDEIKHAGQGQETLEKLLSESFAGLPAGGHSLVSTIPGIGVTTAAVLVSKIVSIDRFETADNLVGYFGVFPEEYSSGVDRFGNPRRGGKSMSKKGNDLVRRYLFCAAKSAITHNPAIKALYARLRARGTRGDVALGHCMRKLLHLVFAVWKKNESFDKHYFKWQTPVDEKPEPGSRAAQQETAGLKRDDIPARKEVTAATTTVGPASNPVKEEEDEPSLVAPITGRGAIDYAHLRSQFTLEDVLRKMEHFPLLRGQTQMRGPCPFHRSENPNSTSFSVNLAKGTFRCCSPNCGRQGNALDLWVEHTGLPLYAASLRLADEMHLDINPNRGEATRKKEATKRR
jgi:transposase